jgi:protease secretion system membrane fusion protein
MSNLTTNESSPAPKTVVTGSYLRQAAWTFFLAVVGLVIWGAFAPLDEGVPAQGSVVIASKRNSIQHLQGGIIRELRIHEGDYVKQGQLLLVLEQASSRANMESIRQHYFSLLATESRLTAELSGRSSISFHPDLKLNATNPSVSQHIHANERLFQARKNALQANISALNEAQEATISQIRGTQGLLKEKTNQLTLISTQLEQLKPLVAEGYAPRVQQLDLEKILGDLRGQIEETQGNLNRLRNQEKEFGFKMTSIRQEYDKEASQLLSDINRELLADKDKLTASKQEFQRTEIFAPNDGQVIGLAAVTPGSVIGPGQKIMDIIPDHADLIIEARVQPQVIDRIELHQIADIRFSAFSHSPMLIVEGKVESISKDLLTDPDLKQSYYLARISLTSRGYESLENKELVAGLPAEVIIKTGSRSLFTYLTYPLVRQLHKSLKEE